MKKFYLNVLTIPNDIDAVITINNKNTNTALLYSNKTVSIKVELKGYETFTDSFLMPEHDSTLIVNLIKQGYCEFEGYRAGENVKIIDGIISSYGLSLEAPIASKWLNEYNNIGYTIPLNDLSKNIDIKNYNLYNDLNLTSSNSIELYSYEDKTLKVYENNLINNILAINNLGIDKSLNGIEWSSIDNLNIEYELGKAASSNNSAVILTNSNSILFLHNENNNILFDKYIIDEASAFKDIIYNGNDFAILTENQIIFFNNGEKVINELPNINSSWEYLAYNGTNYVIVAKDGNIAAYSENGIDWNIFTLPSSSRWSLFKFCNDRFILCGSYSYYYSFDGIDWHQFNINSVNTSIQCITYADEKYVCLESDFVHYSEDGINWQKASLPDLGNSYIWSDIAYFDNKFIAINENINKYIYSEDGIRWQISTLLNKNYTSLISCNIYSNVLTTYTYVDDDSIFNIVPDDYKNILLSAYSIFNIKEDRDVSLSNLTDVKLNNLEDNDVLTFNLEDNRWVNKQVEKVEYKEKYNTYIDNYNISSYGLNLTSPTAYVWKNINDSTDIGYTAPLYNSHTNEFYLDGEVFYKDLNLIASYHIIDYSNEDQTLTIEDQTTALSLNVIDPLLNYTTDGINWTHDTNYNFFNIINDNMSLNKIYYVDDDVFGLDENLKSVFKLNNSYNFLYSKWDEYDLPTNDDIQLNYIGKVCNKIIVPIWNSNKYYYANPNDLVFKEREFPLSSGWRKPIGKTDNSSGIILDDRQKIYYTSDGINWDLVDTNISGTWAAGDWSNSLNLYAVLDFNGNKVIYSEDGLNWHEGNLPENTGTWIDLVWCNDRFLAISSTTSEILYSTDGINWQLCSVNNYNEGLFGVIGHGNYESTYGDNINALYIAYNSNNILYSTNGINWNKYDQQFNNIKGVFQFFKSSRTGDLFFIDSNGSYQVNLTNSSVSIERILNNSYGTTNTAVSFVDNNTRYNIILYSTESNKYAWNIGNSLDHFNINNYKFKNRSDFSSETRIALVNNEVVFTNGINYSLFSQRNTKPNNAVKAFPVNMKTSDRASINSIGFINNNYVAVSYNDNKINIYISQDLDTWENIKSFNDLANNSYFSFSGFYNYENRLIALFPGGIIYSEDGINYNVVNAPYNYNEYSGKTLCYDGNNYIILADGICYISNNILDWSSADEVDLSEYTYGNSYLIHYFNNKFIIITNNGNTLYSEDSGRTWKEKSNNIYEHYNTFNGISSSSLELKTYKIDWNSTAVFNIIPESYNKLLLSAHSNLSIKKELENKINNYTPGMGIDITSGVISVTNPTLQNTASGGSAIGIGNDSSATAEESIALGSDSHSTANCAIQIGPGTNSTAYSFSIGFYYNNIISVYQLLDGTTGKIPNERLSLDTIVTQGSNNAVTSDAVYTVLGDIETLLAAI